MGKPQGRSIRQGPDSSRGAGRPGLGPGLSWADLAFRLLFGGHARRVHRYCRRSVVRVVGAATAVGTTVLVEWISRGNVPNPITDLAHLCARLGGFVRDADRYVQGVALPPEARQAITLGAVGWVSALWLVRGMDRGNRLLPALLERSCDLGLPVWLVGCAIVRPALALLLTALHLLLGVSYRRPTPSPHLQHRR